MGLSTLYLLSYNTVMALGWGSILALVISTIAEHGWNPQTIASVYPRIADLLVICQTGAVLEIFHAMFGLVRSPVMTTFLQVLSRLIVLYGAIEIGDTDSRVSPIFVQMVVAWALSEIIRYNFYALNLLKMKIASLTWLRYSAFMILYPVGITGEIGCLIKALPFVAANKPWTVEMPNSYNFTFSWYNAICFILLAVYPFGSYVMYTYMLSQRRKVLKAAAEESKNKKTN